MAGKLSNYIRSNLKIEGNEAKFLVNEDLLEWMKQKKTVCPKCGVDWAEIKFRSYYG